MMSIKVTLLWLVYVAATTEGALYWEQGINLSVNTGDSINLTCVGDANDDDDDELGDLSINITSSTLNTTLFDNGDGFCDIDLPMLTCQQYNNTFNIGIGNVTAALNNAEFTCTATVKNTTISDTITIYVDKEIEIKPNNAITVKEGEMVNLSCTFDTVNLSQTVEWYISENQIPAENVAVYKTSYTLYSFVSYPANRSDNGKEIYCKSNETENDKVYTSPATKINVLYGPSYYEEWFDVQTDVLFVHRGDLAPNVNCSPDCNPTCGTYWTRNGELSLKRVLAVGRITSDSQTGRYICHAANPYGNGSRALMIDAVYGPLGGIRLDINDTDIEVIEGDDVQNISCVAECKPNCTIYWTRVPDFEHKGGELMLTNVSKENTGEYICHARNDYGSANTSFSLRVYHGPGKSLTLNINTSDVVITEGMELNVTCMASCTPECDIWWTRDQNETINQHVLSVHDVIMYLPGNITCTARNKYGTAEITIAVDFNYPPKNISLDHKATTITLTEGDEVHKVICDADCRPLCNYTWYHDDVQIRNGAILSFFDKATPSTSGKYTCVASNAAGESSIAITILVQYTRAWVHHGDIKCPSGNRTDITLSCEAESFPSNFTFLPWYHVYHNQYVRSVPGVTTENVNVLKTPFCGYQDTGTYTCKVEYGGQFKGETVSRQATTEVYVEDKPVISTYNVEVSPDQSTLNITIVYYSVPTPTKTSWYKDGEDLALTDRRRQYTREADLNLTLYQSVVHVKGFVSKLEISKPVLSDNGKYTLIIYNSRGTAKHTVEISEFTLGKFEYGLIFGGVVLLLTLPAICGLYCHHRRQNKDIVKDRNCKEQSSNQVLKRERQRSRSKSRFLSINDNGSHTIRLPSIYDNINDGREARSILYRWFTNRRRSLHVSAILSASGYMEPSVEMASLKTSGLDETTEDKNADGDTVYSTIDQDV